MAYKIVLASSADNDIQNAIDWENTRSQGLGKRFLSFVNKKLVSLSITPLMGSIKGGDTRCVGTEVFQYTIYY